MNEITDGSLPRGRRTAPTIAALSLLVGFHSACTNPQGPDAGSGPRRMVSGTGVQTAPVGTVLARPLVARVLDEDFHSISNVTVLWSVDADGGSVSPLTSVTNGQGFATSVWTLGTKTGTWHAYATTAELQGKVMATFTATATAPTAPPADLMRTTADTVVILIRRR